MHTLNSLLKSLLGGLPPLIQYMVVLAIAMVVLYLCLILTRKIGQRRGGSTVNYDDPEKNDQAVPDLFASTMFRRKPKQTKVETERKEEKKD